MTSPSTDPIVGGVTLVRRRDVVLARQAAQDVDGEELDLPLNQEPGTAAPEIEINYEVERGHEDRELDKDEAERQELDRSEAGM